LSRSGALPAVAALQALQAGLAAFRSALKRRGRRFYFLKFLSIELGPAAAGFRHSSVVRTARLAVGPYLFETS